MPCYLDTMFNVYPFAALCQTKDDDDLEGVRSRQTLFDMECNLGDDWEIVEDPQELKRVLQSELAYARERDKNRSRN